MAAGFEVPQSDTLTQSSQLPPDTQILMTNIGKTANEVLKENIKLKRDIEVIEDKN